MAIPTMNRMVKVYADSAKVERLKCGRPGVRTVRNTICGVRIFLNWLNARRVSLGYERIGFDEDFPLVSIIKPALIHQYLADLLGQGIKPVTALSYVNQLRQLFSKWVRPYYEDRGWKIPQFPPFGSRPKSPRYQRPSPELLAKVKTWYRGLGKRVTADPLWFAATMMLEFAMRNGDIMRLKPANFVNANGRIYLNYTPHKTEHSSGRIVRWPVHADIWAKLAPDGVLSLPELDDEVFPELNRQMRSLGFTGTKGAYELRKICVDHVYQKFGAEMAVSISGDDIKTICHYYADPSQPNIGDVRVSDFI